MSVALNLEKRYTYADILTWPEDKRWELIDGVPYAMASPSRIHQKISVRLTRKFDEYLEDKTCEVYHAPFDVLPNADKDKKDEEIDDILVQPDLLVVCDLDKLADGKSVKGAPDLVIEILSPSDRKRERFKKYQIYCDANVPEIWFIDPQDNVIETFILMDGNYIAGLYGAEDAVPVSILPGFEINMKDIF